MAHNFFLNHNEWILSQIHSFFYCFALNILNGKLNYPNKCGFPFKKGLFHSENRIRYI